MIDSRAFWSLLDDKERSALQTAGRMRNYRPQEVLVQAVSLDKNIVIIMNGNARVVAGGDNGKVALLAIRGPGEIVGELVALDGRPRYATVQAAGQVSGLMLRLPEFSTAVKSHPRIMELVKAVALDRLREADRRRVEFATASVLSRTVAMLVEFAQREPGAGDGPVPLEIISQADLAGLVAASREALTRALRGLRTDGIISTSRGRITILDVERLRRLASR